MKNTHVVTILSSMSLLVIATFFFFAGCEHAPGVKLDCSDLECDEFYEVKVEDGVCDCACAPGWTGPDCREVDHGNCETLQCQHDSLKKGEGEYCYCDCPPGWGGELCEIPVAICSGVECPEGKEPNPEHDCLCE